MTSSWRLQQEIGFSTLHEALSTQGVDELKHRARLFGTGAPSRKGELIDYLVGQVRVTASVASGNNSMIPRKSRCGGRLRSERTAGFHAFRRQIRNQATKLALSFRLPFARSKEPPRPISMLLFSNGWIPDDIQKRLETIVPEPEPSSLAVSELPTWSQRHGEGQ